MIETMETLLLAWGAEAISPKLDVSIRSPLGAMGEDAPVGGAGGTRCLSTVECEVALSRAAAAVAAGLELLAADAAPGIGSRGRVLRRLALLRYCNHPKLLVAEQCRLLAISPRTYRARVDELHVELAAVLPLVVGQQAAALRALPAHAASLVRQRQAREAERESRRADKRRRAASRAHVRALLGSRDGAA
ncbi:MAG: hypothetical protein ACRERX_15660 [Pseudomonas sp.]